MAAKALRKDMDSDEAAQVLPIHNEDEVHVARTQVVATARSAFMQGLDDGRAEQVGVRVTPRGKSWMHAQTRVREPHHAQDDMVTLSRAAMVDLIQEALIEGVETGKRQMEAESHGEPREARSRAWAFSTAKTHADRIGF